MSFCNAYLKKLARFSHAIQNSCLSREIYVDAMVNIKFYAL